MDLSPEQIRKEIDDAAKRRCDFLELRERKAEEKEAVISDWKTLRGILEVHYKNGWPEGDIEIKIKRIPRMMAAQSKITIDMCEIKP